MTTDLAPAAPASAAPLRKLLGLLRPRPAEWVLLAYLAVIWPLRAIFVDGPSGYENVPRGDIVGAAISLIAFKLAWDYFRTGWTPVRYSRLPRLFPVTCLPFVALSMGFVLEVIADTAANWPTDYEGGVIAASFNLLRVVIVRAGVGLAPLLLWFAYGLHVKRHGRLAPLLFVREAGAGSLDRLRDLVPPVLLILGYSLVGDLLERSLVADNDWLMQKIDRILCFGHDPVVALEALISDPLSEWLAFAYVFYAFLLPLLFGAVLAFGRREALRETSFVITLAFALGYVSYVLVPVQGPMFTQQFSVSLDFYYFGWIKEMFIDRYRVERDCFPSLHTALSLLALWLAFRHVRPLGWALLPIVASIPFACIYLRYHYLTDVLAGFLYAGAIAWVTVRFVAPRLGSGPRRAASAEAQPAPPAAG